MQGAIERPNSQDHRRAAENLRATCGQQCFTQAKVTIVKQMIHIADTFKRDSLA
jgi:hypothetical protein